ncbi:metallophosphoesterase [Pseudoalteromonas sp. SWXJZ94C]|uniref:metallophosphoesterase n=1 Tax=unclassified Pseudoalteromonas TaxID=194690 RepID=UPI00140D0461|nr:MULTISPECIES: metallophosphoesterase [unclassified Pseudoalteromonas]MBH0059398.1 metallophosphoesterase [Pseudoalteromonas sp. SWXJZ94C]
MIAKFSENLLGNDYICSDIHGHFSLLQSKLNDVGFNEAKDRLFSLGDLIDRGDESEQALLWLDKPWFYAIQGNHERMLIHSVSESSEQWWKRWIRSGGAWAKDLSEEQLATFCKRFIELPVAIELSLPSGKKVGLVHAELPFSCDWFDVVELLNTVNPNELDDVLETKRMMWRKRQSLRMEIDLEEIELVENIDHVFHGHAIVGQYVTIGNRTFMDLGSYQTGRIGLIEPSKFLD